METITIQCPPIKMKFSSNLLSTPTWGFDAEYLLQIAQFLVLKACSNKYKKTPKTFDKLETKYCEFLRLYDLAKGKEAESKGKANRKTFQIFYRPRFGNESDEHLFRRLDNRRRLSKSMRRRNAISKKYQD